MLSSVIAHCLFMSFICNVKQATQNSISEILDLTGCFYIPMVQNLAGNRISTQTGIGTAIAIAGVAIYSLIKANIEEQKRVRYLFYL